jgi:hypothetical protein
MLSYELGESGSATMPTKDTCTGHNSPSLDGILGISRRRRRKNELRPTGNHDE